MPFIRAQGGEQAGQVFEVEGGEVAGRDPTNAIPILSPHVSRQHFKLEIDVEGQVWVEDLHSVSGTYINGRRIERAVLSDGDVVSAAYLSFYFGEGEPVLPAAQERELESLELVYGAPAFAQTVTDPKSGKLLTPCPSCNRHVAAGAEVCPFCGDFTSPFDFSF